MSDNGWIKIHRKLLDWEWYTDTNVVHLFLHCLLRANHKPKKWRGKTIESGQFITSQDHLSKELPLTIRQIRTALNKLKSTGELTVKTTNKYSMISITNWGSYQLDDRQAVTPATNERQSNDNQMSTNKNVKNDKKVKKDQKSSRFAPPTATEIKKYAEDKNLILDAERFIDFYSSKGWMVGKNKMKDWQAAVRNWCRRNKPDISHNSDDPLEHWV